MRTAYLRGILKDRDMIPLIIILFLGLFLRLFGIDFGLPDVFHTDETTLVNMAGRMLASKDPNPHWFGWPGTTTIYLVAVIYAFVLLIGLLSGKFEKISDFQELYFQDQTIFFLSGRLVFVLFGVASIFMTYIIARRLFNKSAGLLAASFLAISPVHVYHSKLLRPDVVVTLLMMIVFWYCLKILKDNRRLDCILAGFFLGIAVATKYPAVLITVPLILSIVLGGREKWAVLKNMFISGGMSLLGAFLGSPFLFLDFGTVLSDLAVEARTRNLSANGEGLFKNILWYIEGSFSESLSVIGLILVGFGFFIYLFSKTKEKWLLISFLSTFILFIASLSLRWERWIIPVIPFLCIVCAYGVFQIQKWLGEKWVPSVGRVAGIAIFLIVAVPLLKSSIVQGKEMSGKNTRILAKEWVMKNIPFGSHLLVEKYVPPFPKEIYQFLEVKRNGEVVKVDVSQIRHALFRPNWRTIGNMVSIESLHQKNVEYVILSNWYDRLLSEKIKFPDYEKKIAAYEQVMRHGTKVFESKPEKGINIGPVIRIYRF